MTDRRDAGTTTDLHALATGQIAGRLVPQSDTYHGEVTASYLLENMNAANPNNYPTPADSESNNFQCSNSIAEGKSQVKSIRLNIVEALVKHTLLRK